MEPIFTQIVTERFKKENLSAVARSIGIPKAVLHDWVRGKRLPSFKNIDHVKCLADYLGLSLEEILIGQKETDKKLLSSARFEDENHLYEILVIKIGKEKI